MKKIFLAAILLIFAACGNGNAEIFTEETPPVAAEETTEPPLWERVHLGGLDWIVLAEAEGKRLILSEGVIKRAAFSNDYSVMWQTSLVREYLNGAFFYDNFAQDERSRIVETQVTNSPNPTYGTGGGENTQDRVFLLCLDEIAALMRDGTVLDAARVAHYLGDGSSAWWWLRSTGYSSDFAAIVRADGSVRTDGRGAEIIHGGVRPVLWLEVNQ
ncbi:MAG: DUF6273 domain-containing protein [Defluviitaleaceae bacterium]|nr:DUF6273 domain-containing protein [Defluviitaleaceae bacterium]MCL2262431.1 DUF6273 domain-containing protein [Defluviitaleaceae bacterium]